MVSFRRSQVLGSEITEKDREHFDALKEAVIRNDVMVDKLIIKDVQVWMIKKTRGILRNERVPFAVDGGTSLRHKLLLKILNHLRTQI